MNPVANIPIINGDFYKLAYNGRIIPYIKESVFCSFGKNYFASFLDLWADSEMVCFSEINHSEESEQVWTFRPAQNISGAPGAPVQIPIAPANHFLGGRYTHVQPGFMIALPPIGKNARITAVDTSVDGAHVATAVPFDDTYAINVTTAEDIIVIPIQIRKPGSCDEGNSSSTMPGHLFKSRLMIATKDLKIQGSDLASWCNRIFTVETRSPLDPCKKNKVLWHNDLDQMMLEFVQGWNMALLMAEEVSNPHVDIAGYGGTTGYLHALRARGSFQPYSKAAGLGITEFDTMSDKIKSQRGYCTEYGIWLGRNARRHVDDALGDRMGGGQISYGTFQGSQEKAIDFGFQSMTKNGITWHFHEEESLNDPGFLGAAGFNGPDMGIQIPFCQVQCGDEISTPLKIMYLGNEDAGYIREFEQWDHGVLKPDSNNSTCDWHAWHLRSEKGFKMLCPKLHTLIEGL